ncbi:MAG: putative ABC transporter permease [Bacilli bacterium]|nr:putative ABC transporter permease [Bacilli bacterium]
MLILTHLSFINYNFNHLFIFFIIYAFIGWIMESSAVSMKQRKIINSGFLYGPFCPIYGIGALLLLILVSPFGNNYLIIFILSFFIASIWEYYVSLGMEKILGFKWWDYSNIHFNLNGRINLLYSIIWGLLGTILIKVIHPLINNFINHIDNYYLNIFIIGFIFYIIFDILLSIIKILEIKKYILKQKISFHDFLIKK